MKARAKTAEVNYLETKSRDAIMNLMKRCARLFLIAGLLLSVHIRPAAAQEYVLEPGDKIGITFWQQPDLNMETRIDASGKIDVPVAGRLTAAGLTISQLSAKIVERIGLYNRNITQALVQVLEYGSKRIYITGAVALPGIHTFEVMPNVWEAILQAGGPLETAKLDKVTIVRGGEVNGQVIPVDLKAFFDQSDLTKLPELRPGDNIHVPGGTAGGAAGGAGGAAGGGGAAVASSGGLFQRNQVIYIYGQVVVPGRYEIEKDMDVLQALILAGGPLFMLRASGAGPTIEPDMKRVKIITHGPEGPLVYEVDLENYSNEAVPYPLKIRPGDTIYVPRKESYTKFIISTSLGAAITGTVSILVSFFLLDKLLYPDEAARTRR